VLIALLLLPHHLIHSKSNLNEHYFIPEDAFKVLELKFPSTEWIEEQSGAGLAWHESYRIMAYIAMYVGTEDTTYLKKAIHRIDKVLEVRDDKRKITDDIRSRIVPAWCSTRYTNGKNYAWIVHAGMITYPIIRCAYLINQDKDLQKLYGKKAEKYIQAVEKTIHGYESEWRETNKTGEGWYYGDYNKRGIPLNQQNAFGRTILMLWLITGKKEYLDKATKLATYFKNYLIPKKNYYLWLTWGPYGKVADISHAAISVDFAYICYDSGVVFSKHDLDCFVNTFKNCIRKDGFSEFIDGKGNLELSVEMGRWAHLIYIDYNIRQYLMSYFDRHWFKNYRTTFLALAYLVETENMLK